jgi:hypothetical protein
MLLDVLAVASMGDVGAKREYVVSLCPRKPRQVVTVFTTKFANLDEP